MRLYESVFVVDEEAGEDSVKEAEEEIRQILARRGAQIAAFDRWESRKLTYPIKKRRRGLYLLVHFNAPPEAIQEIYRDSQLSERILRVLIVKDEDGIQLPRPPQEEPQPEATHTSPPRGQEGTNA